MKALMVAGAMALGLATAAAPTLAQAETYSGGWRYENFRGQREVLVLSDGSGNALYLKGTADWCGRRGQPYAAIRSVLNRNGTDVEDLKWTIANWCNGGRYARICVQNYRGESACSTYAVQGFGWRDW